jgi:hypothetical protein
MHSLSLQSGEGDLLNLASKASHFCFMLVYFSNCWVSSSMDAPSMASRRTSAGNRIKLGCPFERTKLDHFDVGLCQAHTESGLPY